MATWKELLEDKLNEDVRRFGLRKSALNALEREDRFRQTLQQISSCELVHPEDVVAVARKALVANNDPQ